MELDDLYQDIILDHYRNPRHAGRIAEADALVDEQNPTCGDHIRLTAKLADGRISDLVVDCNGCAICTASASIMAGRCHGATPADVKAFSARFLDMMRGGADITDEELGDLAAFRGVRKFPIRVKCATMPWHAIESALDRLGGRNFG